MTQRRASLSQLRRLLLGAAILAACAVLSRAQTAQDEPPPLATLHVYEGLVQVPTLVLSDNRLPLKPIPQDRFSMSLDSGPKFQPTHVRLEGDDPIALAIVLDVTGAEDHLLPTMDAAIAQLAPRWLHPQDSITIYTLGCTLKRTFLNAPADADTMKRGVDHVLQIARLEQKEKGAECEHTPRTWSALGYVIRELHGTPGRRVILAVTDGHDKGSDRPWRELKSLAQQEGVAIFGMTERVIIREPYGGVRVTAGGRTSEDPFLNVCELSGGMILSTTGAQLPFDLKQFVDLLRGRYIVEFPLAQHTAPGEHGIMVWVAHTDAFIRPAGVSVRMPDPKLLADPLSLPNDPQKEPPMGTRRVLKPSQ
ncbi:hypothetical protein FTO74_13525 [Granulicella sp. WH15]|uniref:hypothetical protein n=1 Tax=Granulicella sp. WH15 TaxID=2602070 RepID=UPI001366C06B|nr:hypothetical protein [Granulicella sp. WH15]QHN04268.1 hypothetical protein FTO74_13525 [Granulicella sp. WH15]